MPSDHPRSSLAADHARTVLERLIGALGPNADRVVLLGGLAAPTLGVAARLPHEGTTDIDIAVEVAMDYDLDDEDFGWLETALAHVGATPTRDQGSWRWQADGVAIDLLCDRYPNEHHGEVDLPGAPRVTVRQLSGPAAALGHFELSRRAGFCHSGHARADARRPARTAATSIEDVVAAAHILRTIITPSWQQSL